MKHDKNTPTPDGGTLSQDGRSHSTKHIVWGVHQSEAYHRECGSRIRSTLKARAYKPDSSAGIEVPAIFYNVRFIDEKFKEDHPYTFARLNK